MNKKIIFSQIILFLIGGIGYPCIEMLYRAGHTHWTMAIIGGIAFLSIIDINLLLKKNSIFVRTIISTTLVILIEFISGIIINIFFKMQVWDYSYMQFNIYGQVCFEFSFYWLWLCFGIIILFEFYKHTNQIIRKFKIQEQKNKNIIKPSILN